MKSCVSGLPILQMLHIKFGQDGSVIFEELLMDNAQQRSTDADQLQYSTWATQVT